MVPISDRILDKTPKRGDVIVFRKPGDESIDYIKRLVGLPNDTIQVKKGETVKIIVKNLGELVHEYNIGTKKMHIDHQPEMARLIEHDILLGDRIDHKKMKEMSKKDHSLGHKHANSVMLEPNKTGEIIWKFSKDISLEMACNIPGHYETGMVGPIIIE